MISRVHLSIWRASGAAWKPSSCCFSQVPTFTRRITANGLLCIMQATTGTHESATLCLNGKPTTMYFAKCAPLRIALPLTCARAMLARRHLIMCGERASLVTLISSEIFSAKVKRSMNRRRCSRTHRCISPQNTGTS